MVKFKGFFSKFTKLCLYHHYLILEQFYHLQMMNRFADIEGFPGGTSGKESACQFIRHKRCEFDPWVGNISWRRAWEPTLVSLPGKIPWTEESGWLQSMGLQRVGHD